MEHKPPYVVNSNAPRTKKPVIPLQARNWPRWYCPRCQGRHYLEIDVLPAVLRLTCSSCKCQWNVLVRFESATAKPKRRRSEDDIPTDYTGENVLCSVCGNPLECDGECLLCGKHTRADAQEDKHK